MIGDIHGELDGLKKILIHSRLVNEKDDWIGEKSILMQTGDVIDRDPHSWGCVRLLRSRALIHPQHTKSSINILHERGRKVKKSSLVAIISLVISAFLTTGLAMPLDAATPPKTSTTQPGAVAQPKATITMPPEAAGPAKPAQRKAIIIYHKDWGGTPAAIKAELQGRGYDVTLTDNATQGLNALTSASNSLSAGDYLFVYLGGHGYDPRTNRNDTSKATALNHYVGFNYGVIYVGQSAPLFEKIANKGVHLTVIDGSCNGGETVLNATGQKYCAVSTTGVYSPGLTGFPNPAPSMNKDKKPGKMGLWWNSHLTASLVNGKMAPAWESHNTASWMNGDIVSGVPERINQRLFRNDKGAMANLSIFLRPSIGILTSLDLGGWNLHYKYCYLFKLIYPDQYAPLSPEEKAKFTNSAQTYITTMRSYYDPAGQFFTKLSENLNNPALMNPAASVYNSHYVKVWQTLANDPAWSVNADPGRYASKMKGLNPAEYKGTGGFIKIAGEIEFLMSLLKNGYAEQELLLKQIDSAAQDLYGSAKVASMIKPAAVMKWPPEPGEQLNRFNQFERRLTMRNNEIEKRLNINREYILKPLQQSHSMLQVRPDLRLQRANAQNILKQGIERYKNEFNTPVKETFGLSPAAINALKKQRLEDLIRKFKAIAPTLGYAEGRISFLLAIVEDSVSKIQGGDDSPCDRVQF